MTSRLLLLSGESLMRGRKPLPLSLAPGDRLILREIARSRSLPFYQVQHARVVLAIVEGLRVQEVAAAAAVRPVHGLAPLSPL